jgi:hypothetical protein
MKRGDRISWMTVNGIKSGAAVDKRELGYLVLLDNGKYVIVSKQSIIL